ncbi:hypothetical protein G7046_g3507 [Stylonectria norvegica]|nr:hypothetical protein G7046_g3507 [Stylonectria norvegica]
MTSPSVRSAELQGDDLTLSGDGPSPEIENKANPSDNDMAGDVEANDHTDDQIEAPPDGGTVAWLQVLAGHLVVFNSWGFTISFGIFQPYFETSLSLPPSTVSWIGSIQICLIFLVGAFSGRAFDAGHYRLALLIGCFLQVLGIFMTSISTEYYQLFLSQGVCQGLGNGIVFAPTIANVATYFSTKRTIALSAAACGGATGGVVFPLIAQQLLTRIGFSWTMRVMGLVVLVNSVLIFLIARTRLPPRKAGPVVEWAAFKEATYVLYAISMFFTLWATYFAYYYARTYASATLGASSSDSFTILIIINVVGIPGRMIPALLADKYFGAINVFVPTILSAALCIYLWAEVHTLTSDYVWVVFFGYFGAGIQSLFPATLAGLTNDLSKNGTRIGMVFTIISIAALTGPPLAGKLMEITEGKYLAAQMWGGTCLVVGAAFLVAAGMAIHELLKLLQFSSSTPRSTTVLFQACPRPHGYAAVVRERWSAPMSGNSCATPPMVCEIVLRFAVLRETDFVDALDTSPVLAPALLKRARSLTSEHNNLQKTLNSNFDTSKAKRAGELSRVAEALKAWEDSQTSFAELKSMIEDPEQDPDLASIARDELETEKSKLDTLARNLSASLTPRHPFADFPCMIEFRPGPGGLEGRYFTDTLFKMYKGLCMRKGYRHNVMKYEFADTAGDSTSSAGEQPLQEAIIEVLDPGAYDIFRSEAGMHRVQRIPSTESKGRVHTSAVAVWVLPSFPESSATDSALDDPESDFYINPSELRIETMRARGAGGQHVNKTESAIRMTHIPSGTVVSMQDHRSQQRNREEAWKLMRSRVADQRREQREEEASRLRDSVLSQTQITRGDKIRTYNYNQDRCTDHRAGLDVHNLPGVLEGGEGLDRIMDGARDYIVGKDIEILVAGEEAKERADLKKKKS